MIYYIASYPRSGNAMLRSLISMNFQVMVTPDGVLEWEKFVSDYSKFSPTRSEVGPHLVNYCWPKTGVVGKMIAPGYNLSLIQRRVLASSGQKYFVKTHEWPYSHYVEGEKVIQIVRHPGDTLLSHAQFLQDHAGYNVDLHTLIRGEVEYGSWSGYHDAWAEAKLPKLFLSFENIKENAAGAIPSIGKFINSPIPDNLRIESFAQASHRNPTRNPKSRTDEWKNLPEGTIRLMEKELGRTARRFGYEIEKRNFLLRLLQK